MSIASPIEQFDIRTLSEPLFHLGGQPVAFTTSSLWMILALTTAVLFMAL